MDKLSTGKVECTYYWCFNKVPVYSWLNFKLKRDQDIAAKLKVSWWIKKYLSCCWMHIGRVKYYKHMWSVENPVDNETTRMCLPVYQHHQRPDVITKITWHQVRVLARHKHWLFFLWQNFINHIYHACMLLKFSRDIWAAKAHTSGENYFFCGFRGENEKCAEIRAGSLSCLAAWFHARDNAARLALNNIGSGEFSEQRLGLGLEVLWRLLSYCGHRKLFHPCVI